MFRSLLFTFCFLIISCSSFGNSPSFPIGYIPLTSIYKISPLDAQGNRMVEGLQTVALFTEIGTLPLPSAANQQFADVAIELAPGQLFSGVFVPTAAERNGDFSADSAVIIDPMSGQPFPGNIIPASRLGGVFAFRVGPALTATTYVPITPCRVADTRGYAPGAFGGPILAAGTTRDFAIPSGICGVPSTATAYALNVTVVPPSIIGFLTVWPSGASQPLASTLNSDGRVKAVAAIVPAGVSGAVSIYSSHDTHAIIDVSGYFVPSSTSNSLAYYTLTPCRVMDTRWTSGINSGPKLSAGETRVVSVVSGPCTVPASAQAYSVNFTVVPDNVLGFLASWPTGQSQPLVSTLNAANGTVTANAAIVPAGTNGSIDVYVSHPTHAIIDIDGYFAPPVSGGLSYYAITPCRSVDTRFSGNYTNGFSGTVPFALGGATCGLPVNAQALALNVTVVPSGPLGFLSLWADGQTQPLVSTLNSPDGAVTSNLAVVPTINGSVDIHASSTTQVILDAAGFFAP